MSAVLTSRDHAVRLALWLVLATEALLFMLGFVLNGATLPSLSVSVVVATLALAGAVTVSRHRIALGAVALAAELFSIPTHGKAFMFLAGLHAAQVVTGLILVGWTMALPRWRRARADEIATRYWTFIAIAWLVVLVSAHRP